jgi:nucleolar protein 12
MDACNAYVIFAHPHPDRPTNVAPVMNPFEAATAVLAANGSTFMSRTIRVDRLRLPSAIALETATNALSKRDAWLPSNADPKKSLFVGGLDYAAKEEDVRVLFEELVKSERGASTEKYVTGVRIVRDAATQLGKGFGYINFKVSFLSTEHHSSISLPWPAWRDHELPPHLLHLSHLSHPSHLSHL